MKRRWLILLLFCLPGIAGQSPAALKPTLFVVHAKYCGPCRNFDRVWCANAELREALQDAFDVRELDWARASEQSDAVGLGVTRLPSFVAVRGTRSLAMSVGFTDSAKQPAIDEAIAKLMRDLGVEWPRSRPPIIAPDPPVQAPSPKINSASPAPTPIAATGPTIDQTARDGVTKLITQSRELQATQQDTQSAVKTLQADVADVRTKISDVRSQVTQSSQQLSEQLQQSHASTRTEISTITARLRETIERTREPAQPATPEILTEISEPAPGAATGDGSLLGGIAKIGIGAAAVYFGLPAGVGVAAFGVISWLVKRRKGAGHRPGTFPGSAAATSAGATPLPREYTEAVELLQLAEREGRIPIHEAIRGTLADDEIDRLAESIDPSTRQIGVELRDRIARRFNTVAPISQDPSKYQE